MFNDCITKIDKFHKGNGNGNIFRGILDSHLERLTLGTDHDLNVHAKYGKPTDFSANCSNVYYVTGDWDQAILWARNHANLRGGAPGIVNYKFKDTLNSLKSRYSWYILDNYDQWSEFVKACRNCGNQEKIHSYDVVEGPYLVNPSKVERGEQDPIADGHQIALCSPKIVQELQYVTFNIIGDS